MEKRIDRKQMPVRLGGRTTDKVIDSFTMAAWRMTDEEYDFFLENCSDEELNAMSAWGPNFTEGRAMVAILEKYYKLAKEFYDQRDI